MVNVTPEILDELSPGQRAIVQSMIADGDDVTADAFAYLNFGIDIDDLTDEQLQEIPEFLLTPWLEEQERELD